jgi:hypothetical protein
MPSIPPNPIEGPRKRKIPLDDNGEPVQIGKKKVGPGPAKKAKKAPEKSASTRPVPVTIPVAGPSRSRARSASVEDVPDEIVSSVPPLNPRNILEAADGSDDKSILPERPPQSESAMDVDDEMGIESEEEVIEEPEESDEAELSVSLFLMYIKC